MLQLHLIGGSIGGSLSRGRESPEMFYYKSA